MKRKQNFTRTIMTTLCLGLVSGIFIIFIREALTKNNLGHIYSMINNFLFADITTAGHEKSIGLFFIIGQIFLRSLQMLLIPLIFTSIIRAIENIKDTALLNKLAKKGFLNFISLLTIALILATLSGMFAYSMGWFRLSNLESITLVEQSAQLSNPLLIVLNAFSFNIFQTFSNNGNIIAVVTLAIIFGIMMQQLDGKVETLVKINNEVYTITMKLLEIIITKFGPFAIYCLLVRTFAAYGIDYLRPALIYMLVTVTTLLILMYVIFPSIVYIKTGLSPLIFISKIHKVAAFGFSTSSSAATLPLAQETIINDLGVSESVASFITPLASTLNMTGTAIMQVIATLFIASVAGYEVTLIHMVSILALTIVGSISTPAAPGAGAILLFTIISGMGYTSPEALAAYSFILAINRPVEMLVTAVNVVDDMVSSVCVAHDMDELNETIYNRQEKTNRKVVTVHE